MKPELEKLLDREFLGVEEAAELEREAEETALAEYEAEQPLENYETPVLRVNPAELPARNYDTIEELLSVRELVRHNQEYGSLDEKIKNITSKEYENKLESYFGWSGLILGAVGGIALPVYLIFQFGETIKSLNQYNQYITIPLFAITLPTFFIGGMIFGLSAGLLLNDYITNNSKKKKQFEKQKEIDLAKTNQRKQKLYEQLTSHRNKLLKGNIILFNSNQTGYSLGYVQSVALQTIEVQQEYVIEEDLIKDQRKPIHKLKPTDFLYVLTPDHDLSADDLTAMDGEAITCQVNGRTELGFTKVEGGRS